MAQQKDKNDTERGERERRGTERTIPADPDRFLKGTKYLSENDRNSHIKNWWFSVWWDDRKRLREDREKEKLFLCCLPNHTSILTTSWGNKIKATEVWKTITSISVPPWHHLEAGSLQHKSYYWFPAARRVKEIWPSLNSNPSLENFYTGVDPHKNV